MRKLMLMLLPVVVKMVIDHFVEKNQAKARQSTATRRESGHERPGPGS